MPWMLIGSQIRVEHFCLVGAVILSLLSPVNAQHCSFEKVETYPFESSRFGTLNLHNSVFEGGKFYLFFGDTSRYAVFSEDDQELDWKTLKTCGVFHPYSLISNGNGLCFLDKDANSLVFVTEINGNEECLPVVQLDQRSKGNWLTKFRNKRAVNFEDQQLTLLIQGGMPDPSGRTQRKFYGRQKVLGNFDVNGSFQGGFAFYDSLYVVESDLHWSREVFATFCKERREYFVGSYVTPVVRRYDSQGNYLGRLAPPDRRFSQQVKPVRSNREQIFLGLKYDIEHHTFGDILLDNKSGKIMHMHFEAEPDSARADSDFLHLLFFESEKGEFCIRPNPILEEQSKQYFAMELHLIIYNQEYNYEGVLRTDLPRSARFVGSNDAGIHYFLTASKEAVTIEGYTLKCGDISTEP